MHRRDYTELTPEDLEDLALQDDEEDDEADDQPTPTKPKQKQKTKASKTRSERQSAPKKDLQEISTRLLSWLVENRQQKDPQEPTTPQATAEYLLQITTELYQNKIQSGLMRPRNKIGFPSPEDVSKWQAETLRNRVSKLLSEPNIRAMLSSYENDPLFESTVRSIRKCVTLARAAAPAASTSIPPTSETPFEYSEFFRRCRAGLDAQSQILRIQNKDGSSISLPFEPSSRRILTVAAVVSSSSYTLSELEKLPLSRFDQDDERLEQQLKLLLLSPPDFPICEGLLLASRRRCGSFPETIRPSGLTSILNPPNPFKRSTEELNKTIVLVVQRYEAIESRYLDFDATSLLAAAQTHFASRWSVSSSDMEMILEVLGVCR
ncbi:hypothetical protein BKA64DRAFT_329674 [Cadophora sp. MPI-SDFR-AT-0126]|nr:hypothetical protein BKA64DRAFT_329674 [Leotiomycetes sp. MPI-SDFR-AT-0126]